MAPVPEPNVYADLAVQVLATAQACLDENDPLGAPANVYVSHCRPPDDCCNILSVWFEAFRPTRNFAQTYAEPLRCNDITVAADLKLMILRDCYPTAKDNARNPFPPPSAIQAAADSLNVTARVLWCCMIAEYELGTFTDMGHCADVVFGPMVPICPRGGCAGWEWSLTLDVGPCC